MGSIVRIPDRISRLVGLATNLWWSWNPAARALFKAVSYPLWRSTRHNPVSMLQLTPAERLEDLARDRRFLALYDQVVEAADAHLADGHLWFPAHHAGYRQPVAYFSAEFGLHGSLPIYSGGLGVLSGDHCKEASDLGLPFVGVGFCYPQGYFRQHIPPDGWQEAIYDTLDFDKVALQPVLNVSGERLLVPVPLRGTMLHLQVWKLQAGRVPVYLMDSNVPQNEVWDRTLLARLYGGDQETRIRQELVLGVGGVRLLRALGIVPAAWHLNEGHSAFLVLERLRELVQAGRSFDEAVEVVRATTVFTTHTPVPAGHDAFPFYLIDEYFGRFWERLGVDRRRFMQLGEHDGLFNMTVLALRLAGQTNAVSELHGQVSRQMWQSVWPGRPVNEVPIRAITNGVHVPSWISTQLKELYATTLGDDWEQRQDESGLWERVEQIEDVELWSLHQALKLKLLGFVDSRTRQRWHGGQMQANQVLASGVLLDPEALTLGFARRFATYKRATLIFRDVERLKRLIHAEGRPMQIVFAGKAHPADPGGKELIRQVYQMAADPEFGGRVAFLEDYDLHVARFLVQGVDVWLNNPRRPNEASGTSGMKAAMNGVPNLSILDGWWVEGYRPGSADSAPNGWTFGEVQPLDPDHQDDVDSQALYRTLEEEVVPLYYDRDAMGLPRGWIQVMKAAVRSSVPVFSTRRMVKEYTEQMYLPALRQASDRP